LDRQHGRKVLSVVIILQRPDTELSSGNLLKAGVNLICVLTGALIWLTVSSLFEQLTFLEHTDRIHMLYLPAGIRLAIVLIFGVWGALGIALATPLILLMEYGGYSPALLILHALISGFVALLTVRAVQYLAGIDPSLGNLKPLHLPSLALAVSATVSLAFTIKFHVKGEVQDHEFLPCLAGMMLGDFTGCMAVLIILRFSSWLISGRRVSSH